MIGIAMNLHDHNTYNGTYHYKAERTNRIKHNYDGNIKDFTFMESFFSKDTIIAFSTTDGGIRENPEFKKYLEDNPQFYKEIKKFKPKSLWDNIQKDNLYYVDHHCSHSAYTFLSSGYEESDILAIDGLGVSGSCCMFIDKDGNITDLTEELPLGRLWNIVTRAIGFGRLQEGKAMGLSGYGKYNKSIMTKLDFIFQDVHDKNNDSILQDLDKFDLAYNIQLFTLEKICDIILPMQTSKNICIAGGVAYNGYMNELFTKHYSSVFVPPAPGDEGQAIGCYMHADYVLNDNRHIPELYAGLVYNVE
jgi:predicted NodU family carbamoyl transferase